MSEELQTLEPGALLRRGSWVYLALAISAVLWLGLRDGAIPLVLFVDPSSWAVDLAAGVGAAVLVTGSWQIALRFLASARTLERIIAETVGRLTRAEIGTLALLSGFSEELFFRGAVQSQWGIVAATGLFALLHLGPGREFRLWTVFALFAGAALGALMLWTGNLLAPTVAHVLVNLVGLSRLPSVQDGRGAEGPNGA